MPNKTTHLFYAAIVFAIYWFILDKLSLTNYLAFGITIFIGAIVPDILDPWTKENRFEHRSVWHSTNLIKPLYVIVGISFFLTFANNNFGYLLFFAIGYLTHLGADSLKLKTWSKGLKTYPTFMAGIKEKYKI